MPPEQQRIDNVQLNYNATVTRRGAVLLGKSVACDGYEKNRPIRIITHAHADHTGGLRSSLREKKQVLMTEATRDLINVLDGPLGNRLNLIQTLEYEKPFEYENEKITLFKADHILGSAQVLVETQLSERIVWTGDFKIENTPVLNCDTLVVESTYGNPVCKRCFDVDVRDLLVSLVEEKLKEGPVYVFGYNGKLQEIMQILHLADVEVPFIMPERIFNISQIAQKHGMELGSISHDNQNIAKTLLNENLPCVAFYHMNCRGNVGLLNQRISVSGWEFRSPCRRIGEKEHVIALSDHSDFDGLIEYVKKANPKQVITDNHNGRHGETLAKEINSLLNIPALAMPNM